LFRTIEAGWLLSEDGSTAFIEMARASGLSLLQKEEYNCMRTTTQGTGQLVKEALDKGVRRIIIGIGGSATNDGGMGLAAALGYKVYNKQDEELLPVGGSLSKVARIDSRNKINTANTEVLVACDVKNRLLGKEGASRVYGPQKGATPEMVEQLENGMKQFAGIIKKDLGVDVTEVEGGGAAGGLGAGAVAFLNATLVRGIDLVMEYSGVEKAVADCDLLITGEGRLDEQTLQGKVVAGIAALGKKYGKPVIVLCGSKELSTDFYKNAGITAAFSIMDGPASLDHAMAHAEQLLSDTAFQVGCLLASVYPST
jgi:glycerate kinase